MRSSTPTPSDEWFDTLCDEIIALKIQGAEHVARAALEGVARLRSEHPGKDITPQVKRLLATRPTEPMMRNAVNYFLAHADKEEGNGLLNHILGHLNKADQKISAYAADLIKNNGVYCTHCHSSTVVAMFLAAKAQGKKFTVYTTETRPLFQGRKTANELAAAGISVIHTVDSSARVNLKECTAVFLGADALLADGKVANKIGSEMVAELAYNRKIPVYVLANSWKYEDKKSKEFLSLLERRDPAEVWPQPPAGVEVRNEAFELIRAYVITGIITEFGIREPSSMVAEIRSRRAWQHIDDKNR